MFGEDALKECTECGSMAELYDWNMELGTRHDCEQWC